MAGPAAAEAPKGKTVIKNVGLMLSGALENPVLDADTLVAVELDRGTIEKLNGGLQFSGRSDGGCYPDAFASIVGKYSVFGCSGGRLECVVLNACASFWQGWLVSEQVVPKVVVLKSRIDDRVTSPAFAKGFYESLGVGEGVDAAYLEGCNTIRLALDPAVRRAPAALRALD